MKNLAILAVLLLLVLGLAFLLRRSTRSREPASAPGVPADVYLGLRAQVFQASRAKYGFPAGAQPTDPWGAVMDWGLSNGSATVVAFVDGSASVYWSTGGGAIGGKPHESISSAAKKMVAVAAEFEQLMHPTTTYPLPKSGEVNFYILTDEGIFTAGGSEKDLSAHSHPLARLGDAAQNVITQYRLIQEKK